MSLNSEQAKAEEYKFPINYPGARSFRLLVEPFELPEKTSGGVIISKDSKELHGFNVCVGRVISMGPECYVGKTKTSAEPIAVNDFVLYGKYNGNKVKVRQPDQEVRTFIIINDDEVQCVIDNPEDYLII